MKYRNLLIIAGAILFCSGVASAQTGADYKRTWTQTSVQDFTQNQLINSEVVNQSGGEVQIIHPITRIGGYYKDENTPRFAPRNSKGEYLKTWIKDRDIWVQKMSKNGTPVCGAVRLNDTAGTSGENSIIRTAFLDDHSFMVTWMDNGSYDAYCSERIIGQAFRDDTVKTGANFFLDPAVNGTNKCPEVMYNNSDSTYWIFYSMYNTSRPYNLIVQRRDRDGNKKGDVFYLNSNPVTKHEYGASVVKLGDKFLVVWEGEDTNISTDLNIYSCLFNMKGEAVSIIKQVNTNMNRVSESMPYACADSDGHVLIVWMEDYSALIGRVYSTDGKGLREQVKLSDEYTVWGYPYIDYKDGQFTVSYLHVISGTNIKEIYACKYALNFQPSGEMISSVKDLGQSGIKFLNISWSGNFQQNTAVKFKIRTAADAAAIQNAKWYGPADTLGFYTMPDTKINPAHNGDRFAQYKTVFSTSDFSVTPVLDAAFIEYAPVDTLPPAAPGNFAVVPGHSWIQLKWDFNAEPDMYQYVLYRGSKSGVYDTAWTKYIPASKNSFADSGVVTGRNYYYKLAAIDLIGNEGPSTNEISCSPLADKFYVSVNGNGAGTGTVSAPFATITQAINTAVWGDTVMVLPGTYDEKIVMKEGVSVIGSGAMLTTIKPLAQSGSIITGADKTTLKGFTIEAENSAIYPVYLRKADMIITENRIIYTGASENSNPAIMMMDTSASIISKNFIADFKVGVRPIWGRTIIRNNVIIAGRQCINAPFFPSPDIINNTLIPTNGLGIQTSLIGGTSIIKNNIIAGSEPATAGGIYVSGSQTDYELPYNNVWNVKTAYSGAKAGTGSLSVNPMFRNMLLQDFRLQANSPCLHAGDPAEEFNNPDGTRNDMGAFGGPDPINFEITMQLAKELSLSTVYSKPGDTVTVELKISKPAGILSGAFKIKFEKSLLKLVGINKGNSFANTNLTGTIGEGFADMAFNCDSMFTTKDSVFIRMQFIASANLSATATTPVSLSSVTLTDALGNDALIKQITNGLVIIEVKPNSQHTVYVNNGSQAGGDGSYQRPFTSIQQGIDAAGQNDTVWVSAGVYFERLTMKSDIVLTGAGTKITLLKATDWMCVLCKNISNSEIANLTIFVDESANLPGGLISLDSSKVKIHNVNMRGGNIPLTLFEIINGSSAEVYDCSLYNGGANIYNAEANFSNNAVSLSYNLHRFWARNNSKVRFVGNRITLQDNDRWFAAENSEVYFKNNRITLKGRDYAFALTKLNNSVIANNIIEDKGSGGYGFSIGDCSNLSVVNNTIVTKNFGIQESGSSGVFYNNIVTGNSYFGLSVKGLTINYNNIWGNNPNYDGCSAGASDIQADPLFSDGDFHLAANSPCRNAGAPGASYSDADGTRNDIGAYGGPFGFPDSLTGAFSCGFYIDSVLSAGKDTVALKLHGRGVINIADFSFIISYDTSNLKYLDAESSASTRGYLLRKIRIAGNTFGLALSAQYGYSQADGVIAELYFAIKNKNGSQGLIKFDGATANDVMSNSREVKLMKDGVVYITPLAVTDKSGMPASYKLMNNYPNLFNPFTIIEYEIPVRSRVQLRVFDILGRLVKTLADESKEAGRYQARFNASRLSSGVYFYQLKAGSFIQTKKFILQK